MRLRTGTRDVQSVESMQDGVSCDDARARACGAWLEWRGRRPDVLPALHCSAGTFFRGKCSRTFVRECNADGNLSNANVFCARAACPSKITSFPLASLMTMVRNAVIDLGSPPFNTVANSESSVTVHCDPGYYVNGTLGDTSVSLHCGEDLDKPCEWPSASRVVCERINECGPFQMPGVTVSRVAHRLSLVVVRSH